MQAGATAAVAQCSVVVRAAGAGGSGGSGDSGLRYGMENMK